MEGFGKDGTSADWGMCQCHVAALSQMECAAGSVALLRRCGDVEEIPGPETALLSAEELVRKERAAMGRKEADKSESAGGW